MKRKKRQEMAQFGWICTLLGLWGCFVLAGGTQIKKRDVKDPTTVGKLGYQWDEGDPGVSEVGSDAEKLSVRHLLSTNDTSDGDKSLWEKIEDFYSDNNNMAMYCVLPIIILVYGGCSAIYCIYKCRRYLRRRGKHKKLRNEDTNSVSGDERNDLNQTDGDGQPVKTVSGTTWEDNSAAFTDVGYNVQRKKTPLPWDTPQKSNQVQRHNNGYEENAPAQSRDENHSAASRDSTSMALEREREKLERGGTEVKVEQRQNPPPKRAPPSTTLMPAPHTPVQPRPIEIVPISRKEYQQHMEANGSLWDPLHNRPFDSRASGGEAERSRTGRESSWSIRDEIMAKYDALTSLAMAKKTADVLRTSAADPNLDSGHRPDTLRRKPGKKKLIFIAE